MDPFDRMGHRSPLEGILNIMSAPFRFDSDIESLETIARCKLPLEAFCETLLRHKNELELLRREIYNTFSDNDAVLSTLTSAGKSLEFFPINHKLVDDALGKVIEGYLHLTLEYELKLKNKLGDIEFVEGRSDSGFINNMNTNLSKRDRDIRLSKVAKNILNTSLPLYFGVKNNLPNVVNALRETFSSYNKYLKDRFIEHEEEENPNPMFMFIRPQTDPPAKYVKVKLYDNNPVLTDILLDLIDGLPEYKENFSTSKKGKKKKSQRTLSNYAVEDSADNLAALSDSRLIEYITDPNSFFKRLGNAVSSFYNIFSEIDMKQRALFSLPDMRLLISDDEILGKILNQDEYKIKKEIERLKRLDLDGIIQNEDEISPDSEAP